MAYYSRHDGIDMKSSSQCCMVAAKLLLRLHRLKLMHEHLAVVWLTVAHHSL